MGDGYFSGEIGLLTELSNKKSTTTTASTDSPEIIFQATKLNKMNHGLLRPVKSNAESSSVSLPAIVSK